MALKLLQPGLRPVGQFDLDDDETAIFGGEVGILQALTTDGSDAYASDPVVVGPRVEITAAPPSDGAQFCGLIDEGTAGEGEYGTLYGSIIGGTAGQGTGKGTLSSAGVVSVGPRTHFGSGKATLFASPGLYGVTANSGTFSASLCAWASNPTGYSLNDALKAAATGKLEQESTDTNARVGCYIGPVNDSSLVSTTFTHASGTAGDAEYHALWFSGHQVYSA